MKKIICLYRDKSEIVDSELSGELADQFTVEWQKTDSFSTDGHLYVCPFFFVHEFKRIMPEGVFFAWGFEGMALMLFEAGASDFMRSPWAADELLARSSKYFGRSGKIFSWGTLYFDGSRTEYEGVPLLLTPREHKLLALLANNAGKPISRRQIELCLAMRVPKGSRAVHMAIVRIRQELEIASARLGVPVIRCLYSVGYFLME